MEKRLMTLKEFCVYVHVGMTKARATVAKTDCPYSLRIGNRIYIDQVALDEHITECRKSGIPLM